MDENEIKERADRLIGKLEPTMTREERDGQVRQARNQALGHATPNLPYRAAHTVADNALVREIDRRWTQDLEGEDSSGGNAVVGS
jgi:hypothetical protein